MVKKVGVCDGVELGFNAMKMGMVCVWIVGAGVGVVYWWEAMFGGKGIKYFEWGVGPGPHGHCA